VTGDTPAAGFDDEYVPLPENPIERIAARMHGHFCGLTRGNWLVDFNYSQECDIC
jgi:hypothetical protein